MLSHGKVKIKEKIFSFFVSFEYFERHGIETQVYSVKVGHINIQKM